LTLAGIGFFLAGVERSERLQQTRQKEITMKLLAAITLLWALSAGPTLCSAQEQTGTQGQTPEPAHYTVTDLGTLGGTYSYGYGINNAGVVSGGAATQAQTDGVSQTAFLWDRGHFFNLGTLGGVACPDCSSEAGGPNAKGESPILSETSEPAYMGEDFCGFGTHRQCLGVIWKNGKMTALSTLRGGQNSQAYWINDRGQAVGFAENGTIDPTCASSVPFQVLRFEAVIWGPNGDVHELHPLKGDTVGFAFGINDKGQAVGATGVCSNTSLPPVHPAGAHAVLWEKDGTPIDLGSLAGLAPNVAGSINNLGQVVGTSPFSDGTIHTFLWTRTTGMQDLGTLPGAVVTVAPCCHTINDNGQVAGYSIDAMGNMGAFLWRDGVMSDLNALIPDSPLYLLAASSINDAGEIAGFGVNSDGDVHAFLATPRKCAGITERLSHASQRPRVRPENVRELVQQRLSSGRFGVGLNGPH
jgi:probable HAF family extracellular repeat protein